MIRNALQPKSVAPTARAARIALGGAAAFLALFAALHVLEPEFDPSWRFPSEYALGSYGWVMVLAFLALASSCVSLFVALRPQLCTFVGKVGLGLVLLSAAGFILSALFTTDPITVGKAALTTSGQIHGWGAVFANFLAFGAAFITWILARNPAWTPARWAMVGAVALIAIGLGWFFSAMPSDERFGPEVHIGWSGRLLMVAYSAWLIAAAWGTLQANKPRV